MKKKESKDLRKRRQQSEKIKKLEVVLNEEDSNEPKKVLRRSDRYHTKHLTASTIILIISVILIIILLAFTLLTPKLTINGPERMVLEYNEKYLEKGFKAKHIGKNIDKKVQVSGSVNTSKIGVYKIKYQLKESFFKITKVRIIKVIDKKKPIITLESKNLVYLCPNEEYKEASYKAIDEYDGDLTDKVEVTKKEDKVIYSVKDKSNNLTEVEIKLIRKDNEKPKIELKGQKTIYQNLNTPFKEPGYIATDNCDGDLTKQVTVTGNIDVNKEGKYTLSYMVKDSANNEITVTRIIQVYKKIDINSGTTKKGTIYLTFDDGPSNLTTSKVLNILKEEGVKATFFVTNSGPDNLIKRAFDEGHAIGLHTASHNYEEIYSSTDNYFADLNKISKRVKKITGQETKLMRFPGGSNNTISKNYSPGIMTILTNEVLNRGYRYYDWNVDANDAWQCAKNNVSNKAACVYNNVTKNLSKSRANIVLMHDIKYHTVDALKDIIRYGKNNGYNFEPIDMDTYMIRFSVNN